MQVCDIYRSRLGKDMTAIKFFLFRVSIFVCAGALLGAGAYFLAELGFFAPLGARIRGLFLEAVKTGNPLVDSVAEHHPSNAQAYDQYLGNIRYVSVLGLFFCWHQ